MHRSSPVIRALLAAAGLGGVSAAAATAAPIDTSADAGAAAPLAKLPAPSVARLAVAVKAPPRRKKPRGYTIVRVRRGGRVALRDRPGGRIVARVKSRTEFGSPQTLTVEKRFGRWLGVTTSKRPNGRVAWVDGRSGSLERRRTQVSLVVDLSRGRLFVRD